MKLDTEQTVSSLQFPGHSPTPPDSDPVYSASHAPSPDDTYAVQHNEPAVNTPVSLGTAAGTSFNWSEKKMPKPRPAPDLEAFKNTQIRQWVKDQEPTYFFGRDND
jgi:hypothetical protein